MNANGARRKRWTSSACSPAGSRTISTTLLTAIFHNISLIYMLLLADEQLQERLDDDQNASHRARDLAQRLLTFARGGAPIKQAVSAAPHGAHTRSEITIDPDLWPAEFDSGQSSQVVANLVLKADQTMTDDGTLHVNCHNYFRDAADRGSTARSEPGD